MLQDLPVLVVEVDVHDRPEVAAMHRVRSVPTFKLYDDDCVVRQHVGAITKQQLKEFLL